MAHRLRILAAALCLHACGSPASGVVTVPVERGSIAQAVTASGTLVPQDTVLVGSQVSGTIQQILVDYNSPVHTGQVLARLDPSTFEAALAQAQGTLAQFQAQTDVSAASALSAAYSSSAATQSARQQAEQIAAADELVRKSRSAMDLSALTLRRDATLLRDGYVAQNVVDADVSNLAAAHAAYVAALTESRSVRIASTASGYTAGSSAAQAHAAVASQRATAAAVLAARAAVEQARINLAHATIVSPVDGTVVARNVSEGQTVAAALQAPTLFTIAKDLRKMELDAAVGEPDVGAVHAGQHVDFTVLAFPGRTFSATVAQVRQNPTVVNNVTTYTTVAYADNRAGLLRPGMTANVAIRIAAYADAAIVPLAALQWRPSSAVRRRYAIAPAANGSAGPAAPRSAWGRTAADAPPTVSVGAAGRLYVLDGGALRPVDVRVLAIDGARVGVRVVQGRLAPGDAAVVDDGSPAAVATTLP